MLPMPTTVRLPPPPSAIAAAVLGLLSSAVPGVLALVILALYEGEDGPEKWLWVLGPAAVAGALVVGAVLLLLGRSWLALVVPAAGVVVLVVAGRLASGSGVRLYGVLPMVVPLAAAVLAALPSVRSWVGDRRTARRFPS